LCVVGEHMKINRKKLRYTLLFVWVVISVTLQTIFTAQNILSDIIIAILLGIVLYLTTDD